MNLSAGSLRLQMPLSDVANFVGVSWDTVKIYDKLQLKNFFDQIDLSHARNLAIDEFSLHKGHRYATVVMDIENRPVLWICKGKTRKAIQPFFELLRQKGCINNIRSISCDMNAAYARLFKEEMPDVTIVYDLFHVMKNFTEVLKEARKRCTKALANSKELNGESIKDLRKAEWVLVKREDDLSVSRKQLLDRLLEDNALLAALAPISQAIRDIWSCKSPNQACSFSLKRDCCYWRQLNDLSLHRLNPLPVCSCGGWKVLFMPVNLDSVLIGLKGLTIKLKL